MDEIDVRKQLTEVRAQLKLNEEEHTVLESLLKGYEGWLRLRIGQRQLSLSLQPDAVAADSQGSVRAEAKRPSFRGSVIKILRDARGEPLHAKEILSRVLASGAKTNGKDPLALTDLQCYSIMKTEPIEKVAPRTWRWKGSG